MIIKKYIGHVKTQKLVSKNMNTICVDYKLHEYSDVCLIGVSRGGLIPVTMSSHYLHDKLGTKPDMAFIDLDTRHNEDNIPKLTNFNLDKKYDLIIICEDIIDSGLSIQLIEEIKVLKDENCVLSTLVTSTNNKRKFQFNVYSGCTTDKWVDFFWENV